MKSKYKILLNIFFMSGAFLTGVLCAGIAYTEGQRTIDADGFVTVKVNQSFRGWLEGRSRQITEIIIHDRDLFPITISGQLWYGWPGFRHKTSKIIERFKSAEDLRLFLNKIKFPNLEPFYAELSKFLAPLIFKTVEAWKNEHGKRFPIIVMKPARHKEDEGYEVFMTSESVQDEKTAVKRRLEDGSYYSCQLDEVERSIYTKWLSILDHIEL